MKTLNIDIQDQIIRVTFNGGKSTNPFSRIMTLELTELCRLIACEPEYGAVILTGGQGRSFSVGGDFNDVSQLKEETEIRTYLGEIIELYLALLSINIPVIAAIDQYAIGQGLQVALLSDWRIGTRACKLQMPELKNGVACPLGSIILEHLLGRAKMLEFVIQGDFIDAENALRHSLINTTTSVDELEKTALTIAHQIKQYPRTPFMTTKQIHNSRFIQAIESIREASMKAHISSFLSQSGKAHFNTILGRSE